MAIALEYRKVLRMLEDCEPLESIDNKLANNKAASAGIAFKLWDTRLYKKIIQ